jgi:hypothetical protein
LFFKNSFSGKQKDIDDLKILKERHAFDPHLGLEQEPPPSDIEKKCLAAQLDNAKEPPGRILPEDDDSRGGVFDDFGQGVKPVFGDYGTGGGNPAYEDEHGVY